MGEFFFLVTYKFVGFVEVSHRRSAKNNVEAAVAEKGYFTHLVGG